MTSGIGINRLRQLLPRFTFRIPACEDGLEALSNYHMVRTTSTGLAVDEPVHDWASHASSALKIIAEAEMAGMLSSAGSTANVHRRPVTVKTGFRGNANDDSESSILDRFFGAAETQRKGHPLKFDAGERVASQIDHALVEFLCRRLVDEIIGIHAASVSSGDIKSGEPCFERGLCGRVGDFTTTAIVFNHSDSRSMAFLSLSW